MLIVCIMVFNKTIVLFCEGDFCILEKDLHFGKVEWKQLLSRPDIGTFWIVLILIIVFTVFTDTFFTRFNIFNILRVASLYSFIALAQSSVTITRGVSLAIGAIGGFCGLVAGLLMEVAGWPIVPSLTIAIIAGVIIGYLHGLIITKLRLNAFVTTLATQFVLMGIVLGITKGYPFVHLPSNITVLGRAGFGPIPYFAIFTILVLVLTGYFFRYTATGRKILATGGNIEAAHLSGVNVNAMVIYCHMLSGMFAGIAACLFTMRLGSIQANLGSDWVMMSFAVTVIAGNNDGKFSAFGVGMAALMMVLIQNGLVMLHVDVYFEQAFIGGLILFAISLDSIRMMSNEKTMLRQVMAEGKINIRRKK